MAALGDRIEERLEELGWRTSELIERVSALADELGLPVPSKTTFYNTIGRGSKASEWSDLIAEVLGVEHRWLQCGIGPTERITHASAVEFRELRAAASVGYDAVVEMRERMATQEKLAQAVAEVAKQTMSDHIEPAAAKAMEAIDAALKRE